MTRDDTLETSRGCRDMTELKGGENGKTTG